MMRMFVSSLALLLAIGIVGVANGQNSDQVQSRVYEQVDNYMSRPVIALQVWSDFAFLGGFPNDMTAPDRDAISKYLYSIELSDGDWKAYYGLEDGLILGYFSRTPQVVSLWYREPGEDGYDFENDEEMAIYKNACVNADTGEELDCVLPEGSTYIACVNDCELVKCADPDSQQDCSTLSGQDKEDCEAKITWCKNYSIETTAGTNPLGYIPSADHCIDSRGAVSQKPGGVLVENEDGDVVLGDCTFTSGALVDRDLSGPYANCGGNGTVCNTTFIGAYESGIYDPRWRVWYMDSKAAQRPRWSDPYIFFSNLEIGITYTHTINVTDEEEGIAVFAGVLAADLKLGAISEFLVDSFQITEFSVAIYEIAEPHDMIAISTGSDIIEEVLTENTTQPCTDEQSENGECTLIQITINDLDSTTEDIVLKNAHLALEAEDFNTNEPLEAKASDDVFATAYLATFVNYTQPGANLDWRIIVVTPLGRDPEDSIVSGEPLFVVVCILAGVGFTICATLVVIFVSKRNERAVMLADFRFTSAFVAMCALLNLSSLALLGENTDRQCMVRMWTYNMFVSMALSPLFIKAYRTWKLLGTSPATAKRTELNNIQAWSLTLPIPLVQVGILTTFTIIDPAHVVEFINKVSVPPVQSLTCEHNNNTAFNAIQGVFYTALITSGCVLAYLTRNIDPRFADAKELLFAMYNILFTVIMFAAIFAIVDITDSGRYMMTALGVFWVTVCSSVVFVVPKIMTAKADRRLATKALSKARLAQARKIHKRISQTAVGEHDSSIHESEETLKVLVCSANIGNAEPTLASMKAWIPEGGSCADISTLEKEPIDAERFDIIAIGMQESTWTSRSTKNGSDNGEKDEKDKKGKNDDQENDETHYLAAVEGADTVALRRMEATILGADYVLVKEEIRGQMRLHIWVLKDLNPFLDNMKVSGANTGVGNVLANKGGIVISFEYQQTRFSFLSAHLAAHEGDSYYQSRCENVRDILRNSTTFKLSQKLDLAVCSHHMFVFGDLNFRTKFAEKAEHEENVERALELVNQDDFDTLYSFDELHKGVKKGDLLLGFETLPCRFPPTFKVEREPGFVYKKQRTPSYTDRILFKSGVGLENFIKPLAYEPCVGFITSDHKPIRGAFSIATNEMMEPINLGCRFRMVFSEMECSGLPAGDLDGFSDPFLMFIWDSIEMSEEKKKGFRFPRLFKDDSWPQTSYISKTLNPKWKGKEIVLVSTGNEVNSEAVLYVGAFDYDFGASNDVLGTLCLSIRELVRMRRSQNEKEVIVDHPLEANGKSAGRIKFKLTISKFIG